jgi:hypothetical protein
MYFYDIGYGTCEESQYWQFFHSEKFTEEELCNKIKQCFEVVLDNTKFVLETDKHGYKDYTGYLKAKSGEEEILSVYEDRGPSIQNIMMSTRFHEALADAGFVKIKFEAHLSLFGWSHTADERSFSDYTGDVSKEVLKWFIEQYKKRGIDFSAAKFSGQDMEKILKSKEAALKEKGIEINTKRLNFFQYLKKIWNHLFMANSKEEKDK